MVNARGELVVIGTRCARRADPPPPPPLPDERPLPRPRPPSLGGSAGDVEPALRHDRVAVGQDGFGNWEALWVVSDQNGNVHDIYVQKLTVSYEVKRRRDGQ